MLTFPGVAVYTDHVHHAGNAVVLLHCMEPLTRIGGKKQHPPLEGVVYLLTERVLSVNLVIEPVAVVCFFSAAHDFLSRQQNLAIASVSNFLSIFMTSVQSAVWNLSDLYGWPWCMTLTFQYFCILSHNSVPAGQNTFKFLLCVA